MKKPSGGYGTKHVKKAMGGSSGAVSVPSTGTRWRWQRARKRYQRGLREPITSIAVMARADE